MASPEDLSSSLAALIDADNANPSVIERLLEEVAKLGVASDMRIYGDWTTPNLGQWQQVLLEHSIQPIQHFRYTTGKHTTDSAMIIDAMELHYVGSSLDFAWFRATVILPVLLPGFVNPAGACMALARKNSQDFRVCVRQIYLYRGLYQKGAGPAGAVGCALKRKRVEGHRLGGSVGLSHRGML